MTSSMTSMHRGSSPCRGGTQHEVRSTPLHHRARLPDRIEISTPEGVDTDVGVWSHREASTASPGRHGP